MWSLLELGLIQTSTSSSLPGRLSPSGCQRHSQRGAPCPAHQKNGASPTKGMPRFKCVGVGSLSTLDRPYGFGSSPPGVHSSGNGGLLVGLPVSLWICRFP